MAKLLGWCREHPVTALVVAGGTVAGCVLAVHFELGGPDLSPWKRALGGAVAGAWLAMFPLGFRLFD